MKKKLLARVFAFLMIFTAATMACGESALAYIPGGLYNFDNHHLINSKGVASCANIKYYIDSTNMPSSVISYYTGTIKNAIQSWVTKTKSNSASARVSFSRVYSEADAAIVIRLKDMSGRGETLFYMKTKKISPYNSNWNKCIVYLADHLWSYGSSQAQRTICHEIGHCLGLAHPGSLDAVKESVMWPHNTIIGGVKINSKYLVITPSSMDNTNIKELYD